MKLKIAAIISQLVAVGLHVYLSLEYYAVKFGQSTGDSICNLSAAFNCDAVAASQYSSFLGIPLSLWGGSTNAILAILLLIWVLRWTDVPARIGRFCLYGSAFIALTSVVMGTISALLVGHYCAFCIGAYIMSFVSFAIIWGAQEERTENTSLYTDLIALAGSARPYVWFIVAIPALAFLLNKSLITKYGASNLDNIVRAMVAEWRTNPQVEFNVKPSMSKGAKNAVMTIQEFADFRCGHCKHAAPSLGAFTESRNDVQLNFYVFPLDGACNDAISRNTGLSCLLAKVAYCANTSGKGWAIHDLFFKHQSEINSLGSPESLQEKITDLAKQVNFDITKVSQCVESDETHQAILAQAKLGVAANVKGTPTIFVNGKKLSRGQLIPVLEGAYKELIK